MSRKEKHFMKLYEPVHSNFEKFCKARVFGEMDFKDLMHDTLLIAYQKFDKIEHEKAFLSFLFGIAIRVLANANRKKRPTPYSSENDFIHLPSTNDITDQRPDIELLYKTLAQLPEVQKEAIILYEIVGFSIKEIAQLHKAGESAIKQRLARGRAKLIELLTEKSVNTNSEKSVV